MMHFGFPEPRPLPAGPSQDTPSREQHTVEIERLRRAVREAKQAAAESLSRAMEAPGPHDTTNTIFVALFEAHCRDREVLFAAMRRLDAAREAPGNPAHEGG
ncbi:hypothetical protein [Chelativorans sp. M5D2P16]|uniref:hypothetical protein n=1 Tax=Chelativorans sp. M5D2P16 TaxID=3095678 RepID=UPI002ACA22BA|nr:hypothetical protein [Chelativorans sp. M5D2P16]MDZ5695666.1 hypothetical protein [Chelativorans sp. M5D2P16]